MMITLFIASLLADLPDVSVPVPPMACFSKAERPAPAIRLTPRVWALTAADGTRWGDTDPDRLMSFVARRNESVRSSRIADMRGLEPAPVVDPIPPTLMAPVIIPTAPPMLAPTVPPFRGGCSGGRCSPR